MDAVRKTSIPHRPETLQVLRMMGECNPMLMLVGDSDGYGTRWLIHGQQVQPAIASYLMRAGFIAESGTTEFGARKLALTRDGAKFRDSGLRWWSSLGPIERLKARVFG
mgnify:CR=1 FL=1